MKRFFDLLFIALVVLALILLVTRPELIQSVWLWLVGFIGYVVYFITNGTKSLLALFKKAPAASSQKPAQNAPKVQDPGKSNQPENGSPATPLSLERLPDTHPEEWEELGGTAVTVLRYLDDGNTTLGLLYVGNDFFCYTLEDSHRDEKVPGLTRIPEGRYPLSINPNLSELTQRYRKRFSWFDYHIEIKNIPDFDGVYLHIGNSHRDTRGCLLLADGVNAGSPEKLVTHSQRAFERFYRSVYPTITSQIPQEITIRNENWMKRAGIRAKHLIPVIR